MPAANRPDFREERQVMANPVFAEAAPELLQSHLDQLVKESGLALEVIKERGYKSILGKKELVDLGFSPAQQRTPGLLIPLWGVDGKEAGHQFRPNSPRLDPKGKAIKYETKQGAANRIDCPPRCQAYLGDPKVSLWINEGSKKADAIACRGACAVSLCGVWGFKGKNDQGGVTFLADWDYIALKGRTVYLAFDSDIVTKKPVAMALARLAEHLQMKGTRVRIVYLPQDGKKKVGIDDFLLEHSLEEAMELAEEPKKVEEEKPERWVPGFVLCDGTIGEMVVEEDGRRCFIVAAGGSVIKAYQYETDTATYMPTDDPLVGQVVHFASEVKPYKSQTALFSEIKEFIHRYLELPSDFEGIAALYVLLTWVFEFAPSLPYLRVIGDWGSGKTRFLQVVGEICFRPIFASGATTPSPVFRVIEKFRGTLVMDEADFKDSSAWVEMVKIFNNGHRPGLNVLRAEKENGQFFPRSYQVFGPKLLATRFNFKDEALESRCLTAEMMPLTREDIPRVLPRQYHREVKELRARLLSFRLSNLNRLREASFGNELIVKGLQPRLQEIMIPLRAMVNGDGGMAETLASFIRGLQEGLFSRRRDSDKGRVLAAIIELHEEGLELSCKAIAERANELDEEATELNAQKAGWIVKKLGFKKDRVGKGRQRLILWDEERAQKLAATHGLDFKPSFIPITLSASSASSALASEMADDAVTTPKDCPPHCPPLFKAKPTSEADNADKADDFTGIKERQIETALGMAMEELLAVWENEGRPLIHLGPGENCFNLEQLLSWPEIIPRHLEALKKWLEERCQ